MIKTCHSIDNALPLLRQIRTKVTHAFKWHDFLLFSSILSTGRWGFPHSTFHYYVFGRCRSSCGCFQQKGQNTDGKSNYNSGWNNFEIAAKTVVKMFVSPSRSKTRSFFHRASTCYPGAIYQSSRSVISLITTSTTKLFLVSIIVYYYSKVYQLTSLLCKLMKSRICHKYKYF